MQLETLKTHALSLSLNVFLLRFDTLIVIHNEIYRYHKDINLYPPNLINELIFELGLFKVPTEISTH